MRALSLWQPWASLWLTEWKVHETRHWSTNYRGPLLVHAAQRIEREFDGGPLEDICAEAFGSAWRTTLPRGELLGMVRIVDCLPVEMIKREWGMRDHAPPLDHYTDYHCGDWSDGRYGWRRADTPQRFDVPIPWRGQQGFFDVPDSEVRAFASIAPAAQLGLFG